MKKKMKQGDEGKAGEMGFWRGVRSIIGKSILLLCLTVLANSSHAEVRLAGIFGNNMVVQCERPVPIWGWAAPDEKVTVTFAGQTRSAKAGRDGRWRVTLDSMPVSDEVREMVVSGSATTNALKVGNVLVGEVWVGSGQSNMAWPLRSYQGKLEAAVANYPRIRLFSVTNVVAVAPQDDIPGKWVECSPQTAGDFAAVLYFMGRDLHKALGVPVGLINSSWGGTIIQAWSRYDSLVTDSEARKAAEQLLSQLDDPAWCERNYQGELARYEKRRSELKDKPGELKALRAPHRLSPLTNYRPGGLYNAMIAPLAGYGIRGVAWYQGEFNNGQDALYGRLLPKMIADWREQWGQGDFPFLVVQLPGCGDPQTVPQMPGRRWAELREAQLKALTLSNTAVVVTIDLGDGFLHPRDKEPFGQRLALTAQSLAYGKKLPCRGPLYTGMVVEGDSIRVRFKHVEGGLVAKDGKPLQGFSMAGSDKTFVWADAVIDGDSVVIKSKAVSQPAAVRYAWADNPIQSLFNKDGLPASPFRTDDWKLKKTQKGKKGD